MLTVGTKTGLYRFQRANGGWTLLGKSLEDGEIGGIAGDTGYPESLLAAMCQNGVFKSVDANPEATYVWNPPDRTIPDEHGWGRYSVTATSAQHLCMVEVDQRSSARCRRAARLGTRSTSSFPIPRGAC